MSKIKAITVEKAVIFFVSSLILICIFLFWPSSYILGGDDSGLYYKIPREMLYNGMQSLIGDNVPGGQGQYFPQIYQAPFLVLIYLTKLVTFNLINVQKLLLGINLIVGYVSFVDLVKELKRFFDEKVNTWSVFSHIGGICYSFSAILIFSLWYHLIFVVYLQAIFPLVLTLWFKSVNRKSLYPIIIANTITSLFLIVVIPFPYIFGTVISILPLLLVVLYRRPKRVLVSGFTLLALIIATNLYVFIHFFIQSSIISTSSNTRINSFISTVAKKSSVSSITSSALMQETLPSLLNQPQKKYFKNLNSYQESRPYYSMNIILFGIILISLSLGSSSYRLLRMSLLFCFIVMIRLFTISTPPYGTETYLWLNQNIPFFSAMRTSIDKFALGYSLVYALTLSFSLETIYVRVIRSRIRHVLLVISVLVVCLGMIPLLIGVTYKDSTYGNGNHKLFDQFDDEFTAMVEYVTKLPNNGSRFMWLPLNMGGYAILPDRSVVNHYYVGLSPLLYLTGRNDYVGYYGIPSILNDKLFGAIDTQDWVQIGKIIKELNIGYLIQNDAISKSMEEIWVLGKSLVLEQKGITEIFGKKLASFGNSYTIYALDDKYLSSKIRLNPPSNGIIDYKKRGTNTYFIHISNISQKTQVIFTEVNSALWVLTPQSQNKSIFSKNVLFNQEQSHEYQNVWSIDPVKIKKNCSENWCKVNKNGGYTLELQLFFVPDLLVWPSIYISLSLHFILIVIVLINRITGIRKKIVQN